MSTLAEIKGRLDAATHGPWEIDPEEQFIQGRRNGLSADPELDPIVGKLERPEDNEFIAHAPTDMRALLEFAKSVLKLHVPSRGADAREYCDGCRHHNIRPTWPCPTVQAAIDAGIEVEG